MVKILKFQIIYTKISQIIPNLVQNRTFFLVHYFNYKSLSEKVQKVRGFRTLSD